MNEATPNIRSERYGTRGGWKAKVHKSTTYGGRVVPACAPTRNARATWEQVDLPATCSLCTGEAARWD